MNYSVFPPEINSILLLDGPGPAPFLEAAAAWDGIASELGSAATAFRSVTTDLAGEAWQGPSSTSMTAAAARYVNWLGGAAAQAGQSATQARSAAAAFESALATIVNPGSIADNRGQLVSLVMSNLFGQNAPAIAAAEAEYEQMWAHDVAVMFGYHAGASATVAQLGQWEQALENLPGLRGELAKALGNGSALVQSPKPVAPGLPPALNMLLADIVGAPADPPFTASQGGTFTGTPSLATKFEEALLEPVKPLLALSGIEPLLSQPNSPLLALFDSNLPVLSLFISNTPPKFLPLLLGETVQQSTFEGMPVVQITPAHPSGEYVVALHGGAFIFPPSIFHWLDYTVMAHQTGATIEVPIYPLLQEGGTAGTVVPKTADFISAQVGQHGSSNVSVLGDSAGGNLALAAAEYMVANGATSAQLPSSMVLLSPWLDLQMTNPNIAFVHDPLLPVGPGQQIGKVWAGNLLMDNPEVSPLHGNLTGLPQTYVYSGSMDSLAPDTVKLQQDAATAGAPFSFVLAHGQIHDWIILTPDGPQYWPQIDQELGI